MVNEDNGRVINIEFLGKVTVSHLSNRPQGRFLHSKLSERSPSEVLDL